MKDISLNFGAVRDSILRIASNEILQENFKKGTLTKFKNALQENSLLKKQYLVFKNFQECRPFKKEHLAERFINQNMKIFKNEKWHSIIEENKKIRIELLGDSHVEANVENSNLFEHIQTLIESTTRPDYFNIQKEQESYDFIVSFLMRETEEVQENLNEAKENPEFGWDYITKIAVSNFNKRYAHLNESEKELLGIILSTHENKKNHLEDLKEEITKRISFILESNHNDQEKSILESTINKVERIKNIPEDKIDDAIIALFEVKENIL